MDGSELRSQLEKYHGESFGWALACCSRDPVEAEDVLGSVYLKILEGRARYGGKAAFRTWLFAVIRTTAADFRRRRRLHRMLLGKYAARNRPEVAHEAPDENIHRSRVRESFARELAALSRRQREVLQLVFYNDLSLSEAAEVMGVSIGSARTHYARGKKRLQDQLDEWSPGHEIRFKRRESPAALS